jgi:hypothetical protein
MHVTSKGVLARACSLLVSVPGLGLLCWLCMALIMFMCFMVVLGLGLGEGSWLRGLLLCLFCWVLCL